MMVFSAKADALARAISYDGLDWREDGWKLLGLIQLIDRGLPDAIELESRQRVIFGYLLAYNALLPWNTEPRSGEVDGKREAREVAVLWQFVHIYFLAKSRNITIGSDDR